MQVLWKAEQKEGRVLVRERPEFLDDRSCPQQKGICQNSDWPLGFEWQRQSALSIPKIGWQGK
jgi:hypothetical protein